MWVIECEWVVSDVSEHVLALRASRQQRLRVRLQLSHVGRSRHHWFFESPTHHRQHRLYLHRCNTCPQGLLAACRLLFEKFTSNPENSQIILK